MTHSTAGSLRPQGWLERLFQVPWTPWKHICHALGLDVSTGVPWRRIWCCNSNYKFYPTNDTIRGCFVPLRIGRHGSEQGDFGDCCRCDTRMAPHDNPPFHQNCSQWAKIWFVLVSVNFKSHSSDTEFHLRPKEGFVIDLHSITMWDDNSWHVSLQ